MAEAIGLAASIGGLINLAISVSDISYEYFNNARHASKAIQSYFVELSALKKVLVELDEILRDPVHGMLLAGRGSFELTSAGIRECEEELGRLEKKLRKKVKGGRFHGAADHLLWPFKEKETKEIVETLHRYRGIFHASLSLNGFVVGVETSEKVQGLERTINTTYQEKILRWLCPIDPSINHNAACSKREPTTGNWLIKSQEFANWWNNANQFLWLYGIPGCGKTVLCSTIVEHTSDQITKDTTCGFAYFYFDFNSGEKQAIDGFLCSVLAQLSCQMEPFPDSIKALYDENYKLSSRPKRDTLVGTLFTLAKSFRRVYVVVDALDECSDRIGIADLIVTIMSRKKEEINILATSRKEQELEVGLRDVSSQSILLQSAMVDRDIALHVRSQLSKDNQLRGWSDSVKTEIETALVEGAHAMFRWADCQLNALRKCLTMAGLRKTLRSLPKTLDDTYSRILMSIDEEYRREAYTVLQLLTFSVRPLHLVEVAEAVAVRPGSDFLDDEEKLRDPHVILSICSSLVVLSEFGELRLAHYSVKEYLVSERIRTSPASPFAMMVDSGNKDIAEICLTYLLLSDQWDLSSHSRFLDFPLLRYATQNWHIHARNVPAELARTRVTPLAVRFLTSKDSPAFKQWLIISKQDGICFQPRSRTPEGTPLCFASYCGLLEVARLLVESIKDADARSENLGDALKAASSKGYLDVVKLSLDVVAATDGHEKDDYTSEGTLTALQLAAWNGHLDVTQLLLNKGADTNAQGPWGTTALQLATWNGHLDVTQLLLNKGADVNAQDPWGTTALHSEAWKGCTLMLKLLLDNGADPETQDGAGGSALHFAAYAGQEEVIRMLLDYGAQVDAKAAFHTLVQKSPKVDELGASDKEVFGEAAWLEDRDERRCPGRTPLHEAAWAGKTGAVRLLVERGANLRAQDDNGWTALHRAAKQGFADTAQLLLDLGSPTDLKDRSEMRMTAYELAAAHKREDVVMALDPFLLGCKSVQVSVCEITVDG